MFSSNYICALCLEPCMTIRGHGFPFNNMFKDSYCKMRNKLPSDRRQTIPMGNGKSLIIPEDLSLLKEYNLWPK
jgi:hypothetical protein